MIHLPLDQRPDYKRTTSAPSAAAKDVRHVDNSDESQHVRRERAIERRRMPDRRRKQTAIADKERRRLSDRRSPLLLNARSAKPEELYCRRGGSIDTKV